MLLWVVPFLWSSNYVIARLAEGVIAPHQPALGRWVLAAGIMLPFVWRGLVKDGAPWLAEWRQLLVLGSLGAWVVLGEVPGWYHAVGAALILPSIWLATRR